MKSRLDWMGGIVCWLDGEDVGFGRRNGTSESREPRKVGVHRWLFRMPQAYPATPLTEPSKSSYMLLDMAYRRLWQLLQATFEVNRGPT